MLSDLATGLGTGVAYGLAGTVLMILGFLLVEILTPGNLREQIWVERNPNLAVVLGSNLLGIGAIVTSAILSSEDQFGRGIASTFGYGILGLILMALSFVVVDLLTPGKLGALVTDREPHPAAWVTAATHLAIAAITAAAIS